MKEPIAIRYARELSSHVEGDHRQTELLLTLSEGMDLLDYLAEQNRENPNLNPDIFEQDVRSARAFNDPWLVLNHFVLMGLPITRLEGTRQ